MVELVAPAEFTPLFVIDDEVAGASALTGGSSVFAEGV
jgi:hypothetical protein